LAASVDEERAGDRQHRAHESIGGGVFPLGVFTGGVEEEVRTARIDHHHELEHRSGPRREEERAREGAIEAEPIGVRAPHPGEGEERRARRRGEHRQLVGDGDVPFLRGEKAPAEAHETGEEWHQEDAVHRLIELERERPRGLDR
jgi:hypothetical protein